MWINDSEISPLAILCSVHLPEVDEVSFRESLDELNQLARTLGFKVIGEVTQKRPSFDAAAYIGPGKLADLTAMVKADPEHTVILVDHEITPSQARHIEEATSAMRVLDRTAVILEIFQRHAHSRQAKLQVEMVRLAYMAPRIREVDHPEDRQRGYIGGKGAGESSIELDRRKIRDRIAELRKELEEISKERITQRTRRKGMKRVAICGYTNAGKSTLFQSLTTSEVYVADKLFATLDTTVRVLQDSGPRILISDTIGFIRNLPTPLIASFRSTLDEALEADLLLHVVDISDPAWERKMEASNRILKEIGAEQIPQLIVFNKIDRLPEGTFPAALLTEPLKAIAISAYQKEDVKKLYETIVAALEAQLVNAEFIIPYHLQELRGQIFEYGHVVEEMFDEQGMKITVRAETFWIKKWQDRLLEDTKKLNPL